MASKIFGTLDFTWSHHHPQTWGRSQKSKEISSTPLPTVFLSVCLNISHPPLSPDVSNRPPDACNTKGVWGSGVALEFKKRVRLLKVPPPFHSSDLRFGSSPLLSKNTKPTARNTTPARTPMRPFLGRL